MHVRGAAEGPEWLHRNFHPREATDVVAMVFLVIANYVILRNLTYQVMQWRAFGIHHAVSSLWSILDVLK